MNYNNLLNNIELLKNNYNENKDLEKQLFDLYNLIKMYEGKDEELNLVEKEILITILDKIMDIYKLNYIDNEDFKDSLKLLLKIFFETINYPEQIQDNIYKEL